MNKYVQIMSCIFLGMIAFKLWNLPGRYQINSVEYSSPWNKSSMISVLLDTSTGEIRKLTQIEEWLIWWNPEPNKSTWESWCNANSKHTTTNIQTK
jgi:hypothetical protein